MVTIRDMQESDLRWVSELVEQLGYAPDQPAILERFQIIQKSNDHKLFVAIDDSGAGVGWIHVLKFPTLEMSLSCELGGLVVDSNVRKQGIGRRLVAAAEAWTLANGVHRLQFTSQIKREDAHDFYKGLGYKIIKNSYYFSKELIS